MGWPILQGPRRDVLDFDGVEVQILDRESFERLAPPDDALYILATITDPGDPPVQIERTRELRDIFRAEFHDIPYPMSGLTGIDVAAKDLAGQLTRLKRRPFQPCRSPNVPHRLIIHCTAGISRSAAVAVVWLKIWGRDPSRLYELFCPNRWVVAELEREVRALGCL